MRQIVFVVFFLLVLLTGMSSFGQGVRVGPDGKVSEQTLSLPYAFANESFGYEVVPRAGIQSLGQRNCGPHRYRRFR
jgi:hypothetical protein